MARPFSTLEVASSTAQSGLGTPNTDPDGAINEPIVDEVLSLSEDQWPPAERVYASANKLPSPDTHEYSTDFPHGPMQYDSDSLVITIETASISPYQQSPNRRTHTIANHLSLSSSSPEGLADGFTVHSQQWWDVAISESETSPGVPSSVAM
ncbi:hypothetical protein V8E53_000824, partial [Lactarius tabidus]